MTVLLFCMRLNRFVQKHGNAGTTTYVEYEGVAGELLNWWIVAGSEHIRTKLLQDNAVFLMCQNKRILLCNGEQETFNDYRCRWSANVDEFVARRGTPVLCSFWQAWPWYWRQGCHSSLAHLLYTCRIRATITAVVHHNSLQNRQKKMCGQPCSL